MKNSNGVLFINKEMIPTLHERLSVFSKTGGGLCIISTDIERGLLIENCPDNVRIIDLRYRGMTVLNTKHPRQEGFWTQYSHLKTGLAKNIVISDTITEHTKIEDWLSNTHELQLAPYGSELSSEEYRHQHNHYQNLLCETFNFSSNLNAVSIWGDSGAFVPGAKSWGAFFSARSWPVKWNGYTPDYAFNYQEENFDAALVGVEIDVLNNGRDWGDPSPELSSSMAKIGVQIVGFGKRNTAAIEVRTEDSDDPNNTPESRRGAWQWGMIFRNSLHEGSTLLHCENGKIKRGIDLSKSTFSEGAVLISGDGEKSGITFEHGDSGEIFSNVNNELCIKSGKSGIKILIGSDEYISISSNGNINFSKNILKSLKDALGL